MLEVYIRNFINYILVIIPGSKVFLNKLGYKINETLKENTVCEYVKSPFANA